MSANECVDCGWRTSVGGIRDSNGRCRDRLGCARRAAKRICDALYAKTKHPGQIEITCELRNGHEDFHMKGKVRWTWDARLDTSPS